MLVVSLPFSSPRWCVWQEAVTLRGLESIMWRSMAMGMSGCLLRDGHSRKQRGECWHSFPFCFPLYSACTLSPWAGATFFRVGRNSSVSLWRAPECAHWSISWHTKLTVALATTAPYHSVGLVYTLSINQGGVGRTSGSLWLWASTLEDSSALLSFLMSTSQPHYPEEMAV